MEGRGPDADGGSRGLAAGAAGALIGGGAGDAGGGQAGQAGGWVQARGAAPASVHHNADAGDGEGGFRDRCRQHDSPCVGRPERSVLVGGRQVAVQGQDQGAAAVQGRLDAADFRHAWKEGEDVALVICQRRADGSRNCVGQVADVRDVGFGVFDGDRVLAAGAFDDVGVHQAGQAGAVGGGGHGQQPQVGAQHALQVEAQGEAEVGFKGPFVDFVQDDGRDAVQAGVGLQAAEQQAFGDDFDACLRRTGAVEAGAVADGFPQWLVEQEGHAGGGGAGGEAAGFQHQDAAVVPPRGVEQGERHDGGLPAPGGATSTALRPAFSAACRAGIASVTGRSRFSTIGG